jgi:dihydroorotase
MAILIKNAQHFNGIELIDKCDVLVLGELINDVAYKIDEQYAREIAEANNEEIIVIDGTDKLLSPGFIDMHVHLREPGYEYKETIESGSNSAAKGGYTTICCMPNTKPVTDNVQTVKYILNKASENNGVSVYPIGAITIGEQGEILTDFHDLYNAGVIALSDDGRGVQKASLMQQAFNQASELKLPLIIHAEDESLASGGHIHDGVKTKEFNLKGIPSSSEVVMVARDIFLAKSANAHVHFAHISAKESVDIIKWAKLQGINVTCEVTPQHLTMSDEDIKENDGRYKVNPPLRSTNDQKALIDSFNSGVIDIIATDHAPHSESEKDKGLDKSYFGMIGLETAFAVLYTKLVLKGEVSLIHLLKAMTSRPADIFKLDCGIIQKNKKADLVLIDLTAKKVVEKSQFVSKANNSPFIGWKLQGWPVMTIASGKVIYDHFKN